MEGSRNRPELSREEQLRLLTKLTDAVIFEEFLQRRYVGAKRFSLEGAESLVPLLDGDDAGYQRTRAFSQHVDQTGAVDEPVFAIGPQPRQIETNHPRPGFAVTQLDTVTARAKGGKFRAKAKRAQHPRPVGRNLDPRPHLADGFGLFQHRHLGPFQRQGPRKRQPRHPGPQNRDRLPRQLAHGDFLLQIRHLLAKAGPSHAKAGRNGPA